VSEARFRVGLVTYLRFPHLSRDELVFVADDDVWLTSLTGGRAVRLSSDRAPVSRPKLSADATQVAWCSRRDGVAEVYVMPTEGGTALRLTYWATPKTRLLGWSADDRVVAASSVGQPFPTHTWAHALPTDGTPGERLPYGPISALAVHPNGPVVVQSVIFREPADWKRYRGGTAAKLWLDARGDGEFVPFLRELDGQVVDPVWIGERLLFVSDHEGHANVYSVTADGSDLRRHSDHEGMYARNLSSDGQRAVYQQSGEIWLIDSLAADAQPTRLDISLPGARSARQPVNHDAAAELNDFRADHTGRASIAELRGTIQWLTHRDGPVRSLSAEPGVRARLPRVAARAGTLAWITDAGGDDALVLSDPNGAKARTMLGGEIGRVLELALSPDGAKAALATHDGRLLVVDTALASATEIERNVNGDASGLVFSPDSAWLAWSAPQLHPLRTVRMAATDGSQTIDVTDVRFVDTEPAFTVDGKHLAFLSARTFDPIYDAHNFELSFPIGTRPYLVPLSADGVSPFDPELSGRPMAADPKDSDPGPACAPVVTVDAEGLSERIAPVPVAAGLYSDLQAAREGLLWLEHPVTGTIGADRPSGSKPPRATLVRWDFAKRVRTELVVGADSYSVSGDGSRIVVADGDELRVGPADHKVEDPAPGDVVTVDLGRIRLTTEPGMEWRQMLIETWRLMRDHFWVSDMAGVDWDAILTSYLPVVDRLATRDDLSEVLWEMIAELGTSHAYERPPAPDQVSAAAFLGADLRRQPDDTWLVERVLAGESSVPAARSPLAAAGVGVRAGDHLVEINGRRLDAAGPGPLLAGLADQPVELTVRSGGVVRRVVVVPVADETPLRYQAWVAGRRAYVHEQTAGRIGYVHVPDMVSTGWAEFNRDLRAEVAHEAMVVDTRDNGGGHTSQLVIERLARRVLGWDLGRYRPPVTYPSDAPRGPLVSIANEMAGSDGDIVNEAFRALGLGQIIGTRTWGGVIGIDGRYGLVDGSTVTQPRYSFWFADVGWTVENHGVDPDVEVAAPPQSWVQGIDAQLNAGIAVLQQALSTHQPVLAPQVSTRPDRSVPRLGRRP
jgi:tricorn protease